MSAQTLLSTGDKYFSYSGEKFGDVSAPATIQLILLPNTGLRDSLVQIMPYFGQPVSTGALEALGIKIKINDVSIFNSQQVQWTDHENNYSTQIFVPRQSKLEILSLNTSGNNTQIRGVNLIGYYL